MITIFTPFKTETEREAITKLANHIWSTGGEDQWAEIVIDHPDKNFSQWMKAQLMSIIDEAEITLE